MKITAELQGNKKCRNTEIYFTIIIKMWPTLLYNMSGFIDKKNVVFVAAK